MATGGNEVSVQIVGVFQQQELSEGEEASPLLVLRDGADRELYVPIGSCEGLAIHLALEQRVVARPITHDLGIRILEKLSTTIERVVVDDLSDGTYYASLHLVAGEGAVSVPAKPGDAVALALRAEAPVFVTEEVFSRASQAGSDGF
jgi:hypothetical protein